MSEKSAQRLKESYTPEHQERFDRMIKLLSHADTKKELDQLLVLYLLDESYSRADIATVQSYVEHLKGWKGGA